VGIVGLTVTIISTYFKEVVEPRRQPATLCVTSSLKEISKTDQLTAVQVTINMKNSSTQKVIVLDSWFNVSGIEITPRENPPNDTKFADEINQIIVNGASSLDHVYRYSQEKNNALITGGLLLDKTWYFDPGEETSANFVVYVPNGKYQLLRLYSNITLSKSDEVEVEREKSQTQQDQKVKKEDKDLEPAFYDVKPKCLLWRFHCRSQRVRLDPGTDRFVRYGIANTHSVSELGLSPAVSTASSAGSPK